MGFIGSESVDLVVTSPPYPMIEMWDEQFGNQNPAVKKHLNNESEAYGAFELMHLELLQVWRECVRVLKNGGIICINIGDATRKVGDRFRLFPNHARITENLLNLGLEALPTVIWRKVTNSPNKFMGSGMFPVNAYITLEHEYILIFRKGAPRQFTDTEQRNRRQSGFFYHERNQWFSDLWSFVVGASQKLDETTTRVRSGAYPYEIPHRLINMFSVKGDTVLDPFLGTGTTTAAAICGARNSIAYELDTTLKAEIKSVITKHHATAEQAARDRLNTAKKQDITSQYTNEHYAIPVKTAQEQQILLTIPTELKLKQKTTTRWACTCEHQHLLS